MISIDGSYLEGGGQILRTATALSLITKKPVHIFNIRARRPNPGLKTQHLKGIEAVCKLCNGRLRGASIASKEIYFYPGDVYEKSVVVKADTAASTGLILQPIMLSSLGIKEKFKVEINGGATFGKWSPPLDYVRLVLLKILKRSGYDAELNVIKHGFYPRGGARANFIFKKSNLRGINIRKVGRIKGIKGISVASMNLRKAKVAERQKHEAEKFFSDAGYDVDIACKYERTHSSGSGMVVYAETNSNSVPASDSLGERGKPAEDVAREACSGLASLLSSGSPVDKHLADQLIPYMALSGKKSEIVTQEVSMHTKTNMWVVKQFIEVEFEIEALENGFLIKSYGVGPE